jgi:hypothetical protein
MQRFHFDVRYADLDNWSEDETGVELRHSDEARELAFNLARGLAKDHILGCREITIRVRDDKPQPVVTLRVSLTVEDRR